MYTSLFNNKSLKEDIMLYAGKIKKNRTREHKYKDGDQPGQIMTSDPHFTKDPNIYEEMEWYMSGNFATIGKIIRKTKAIRHEAQPC
jgi:hypothetical protein